MSKNEDSTLSIPEARWARAAMLLSLDLTVPFHTAIALQVRGVFPWRDCSRDFIRVHRGIVNGFSPKEEKPEAEFLEFVKAKLGETPARILWWWMHNIYSEGPREHLELRHWTLVLRRARRDVAAWNFLWIRQDLAAEALDRFKLSISMDEFRKTLDQVRSLPLSDWDLHLYAINLWNDDLDDTPNGPLSYIRPMAKDYSAYSFWNWLIPELSDGELQHLHQAAERLMAATPGLEFIKRLTQPSALTLALP
jgi:hypothetical protein